MNSRQIDSEAQITLVLESLGLTERDILVFLSILSSGKTTVADVSHKQKDIPRTSIYDIVASLMRLGLVSTVKHSGKIYYQAQGIEHFIDSLESKKKEIEDRQNELRGVVDLFNQFKLGTLYRPGVRFFEGKKGILAIQREIQNAQKPTNTIVDIASVAKVFPRMIFDDNLKDFQKNKVLKRDLMIKSPEAESYLKSAPLSELHKVKWLPQNISFQTDTLIWSGHVAIIDYSGILSGVIIDNPSIEKTFSAWFEMMWSNIPNLVN
jgi:predicted transcriptional regulator